MFVTTEHLMAGLDQVLASPRDAGTLELIVRRPAIDEREVLGVGELSLTEGLVGDTWNIRSSTLTPDGSPHPDMQLNIINARLSALICPDAQRRPLAGDQLHIDLDLSVDNLPAGTCLGIGDEALIEITDQPHRGCKKFSSRFGLDVLRFVNASERADLRLRGINARVVRAGSIRTGDAVRKL